jgi:predicted nucleic acid-binding protein
METVATSKGQKVLPFKLRKKFDNPNWKSTRQAAVFKSKNKMSYADTLTFALSIKKNTHLVTGDNEFKQVEKEIKLLWV